MNKPYPLGADTKNNRNYERAACEKESPNTVVKKNEKTKKYTADDGARQKTTRRNK